MQVYTYSEARQKLAFVLEQAEDTEVLIRRKDGRTFALVPERNVSSPLDVPSIKAKITAREIVDVVRGGRERENINRDVNGYALKILSWQNLEGMEKEKKVKVGSIPFYDCIPSNTTMTGYYNRQRGASRLSRHGTDRTCAS